MTGAAGTASDEAAGARDILEARARRLARPQVDASEADEVDLLVVRMAGEAYAVEAGAVRHVLRLRSLTRLPGVADPVIGLTEWRGDVLTVLDLRSTYGLETAPPGDDARVVVAGEGRDRFGLLVDEVEKLVPVPRSEVRDVPEGVAPERESVTGALSDGTLVLDVRRIVSIYSQQDGTL